MLTIIKHKTRSNLNELKVLAALSQWNKSEAGLDIFYSNFQQELEQMKQSNHQIITSSYGLEYSPEKVFLHHKNSEGEYDRHVATITILNNN
jgi:hypothetical protein